MREILGWLWALALVGEIAGCVAMFLKLTPVDRTKRYQLIWLVADALIFLEILAYFGSIRLRGGPMNVSDMSLSLTVLGRTLWTTAVWLKALFVYRKIS